MPWAEEETLFGFAIAHRLSRIGGRWHSAAFSERNLSPRLAAADAAILICQNDRFAVVKQ